MISGFRREVDENCALLGHYAASSGLLAIPSTTDKLTPQYEYKLSFTDFRYI